VTLAGGYARPLAATAAIHAATIAAAAELTRVPGAPAN
jgi:hypothetical protein